MFATNKERDVHPRVCHSVSASVTQNLKRLTAKSSTAVLPLLGIIAKSSRVEADVM